MERLQYCALLAATLCLGCLEGAARAQLVVGSARVGTSSIRLVDISGTNPIRDLVVASDGTSQVYGMAADEYLATLYWSRSSVLNRASYAATGQLRVVTVGPMIAEGLQLNYVTGMAYDSAENKLYAFYGDTRLGFLEIDPHTASCVFIAATPAGTGFSAFNYDVATDSFYGLNDGAGLSGRGLYLIAKPLSSATYTFITALPGGVTSVLGLAIGNGRAYMVNPAPQPIYVYNLATHAYEASIPNPLASGGTYAGAASAPSLNVAPIGADLVMAMSDSPDCVVGTGGTVTYTITVKNAGPQTAHNVIVTDTLSPAAAFLGSSPSGNLNGSNLTVSLGSIVAGASAMLTVSVSPTTPGVMTNQASAAADEPDPIAANSRASEDTTILAGLPTTAAARGVLSTIAGSSTSLVPGLPGVRFSPDTTGVGLRRPFRSPDGHRWIMHADTNTNSSRDEVILVGQGPTFAVAAQEGVTTFPDRGDRIGGTYGLNSMMGINDAGNFAFSTETTLQDWIVAKNVGGVLSVVARSGWPVPAIPGATYSFQTSNAAIQSDNTTAFFASVYLGQYSALANLRSDGTVRVAETQGVNAPTGQCCNTIGSYFDFDYEQYFENEAQGYCPAGAGSAYILSGQVHNNGHEHVAVANGAVVVQEGVALPNSPFTSPVWYAVQQVNMDADGTWYSYGGNVDGQDWVLRNGAVVAMTGAPITPGSPEAWSDLPYPQTFFYAFGNPRGDYVVGGTTSNADHRANSVVVLNGTRVIARENDPVDLDNNGVFDDGVYIRTFIDDRGFLTDDELWVVARLRDRTAALCGGADLDIGQALIRIPLAPPISRGDANCDGAIDGRDIAAFLLALTEPAAYGSAYPSCNIMNADINADAAVNAADVGPFVQMLLDG